MKKVLLVLLLISCAAAPTLYFDNGVSFEVELARTSAEQQTGLMNRESMPENHGMLFIFEENGPKTFWMKNTLIPLDMLFLDEDMAVVEIKANVPPCKADPCATYPSEKSAKYVLELNAGSAEKNGIQVGAKANLRE
jgi:hypothetical protein